MRTPDESVFSCWKGSRHDLKMPNVQQKHLSLWNMIPDSEVARIEKQKSPTQGSRVPRGNGSCPIRTQLRRQSQVTSSAFSGQSHLKNCNPDGEGRLVQAFLCRAPSWMLFIARKHLKRSYGAQTSVVEQRLLSHAVRSLCLSEIPSAVLLLATPAEQTSSLNSEGAHLCKRMIPLSCLHYEPH